MRGILMFDFIDLDTIQKKSNVALHGNTYPVLIDGNGDIPCLCLGLGSLYQRTMSEKFKKLFTLYTSDFYWVENAPAFDHRQLTIEMICRDVIECARQLDLKNYVVLGHSVFGGLVMELAKYQDPQLKGVIAIGATPGWDDKIIQFKNDYFEQHASPARKQRFQALQDEYLKNKKPDDSLGSIDAYYAESPKYFAKPITREQMDAIWQGIHCNDVVINYLFEDLFPHYDFEVNVDKIDVPVALLAGRKDYDSVPLELWKHYQRPKAMTNYDCGDVGHWPHIEAAECFDAYLESWVKAL